MEAVQINPKKFSYIFFLYIKFSLYKKVVNQKKNKSVYNINISYIM